MKRLYNGKMNEKKETAIGRQTKRINKYLSEAGFCSRREADRLIEAGRVTVNGKKAENGEQVGPLDEVQVDGKSLKKEERKVLLIFYKPRGIVCSTKKQGKDQTVTEYLHYPLRIYPVGRLDKDSEGLLLMTNQGDLVNRIMRAGNRHEKEYLVTVDKKIDASFVQRMSGGVPILDTVTRPCTVEKTGEKTFRIILTQGLNRQIRRMCEYLGYHVTALKRVRIMNIKLGTLAPGEYREISPEEWKELKARIKNSSNETIIETGGGHGHIHTANERADRTVKPGGKGLLSGRPGDYDQSGIRQSVRRTGPAGRRDRNRSGK